MDSSTNVCGCSRSERTKPAWIIATLPDSLVEFFAAASKDKNADAPLPPRVNGKPWNKDVWMKAIKEAVTAAELPNATVVYTLRHSVLTDLVAADST